MILHAINIIIKFSLFSELKIRIGWLYLIISFSIEFCWYRAFFSMNFKNLISDFINLTSILTRSFRNSSELLSTIGKQYVIKYKNDQVVNFWLSYCNFLTQWNLIYCLKLGNCFCLLGVWSSLVWFCVWDAEIARSNLATPIFYL